MKHVSPPPDNQKNFLVVDAKTENSAIEAAFERFTQERNDIAILLINQHVCYISNILGSRQF
jgi:V-type H+-transporting ATPase subunit F